MLNIESEMDPQSEDSKFTFKERFITAPAVAALLSLRGIESVHPFVEAAGRMSFMEALIHGAIITGSFSVAATAGAIMVLGNRLPRVSIFTGSR